MAAGLKHYQKWLGKNQQRGVLELATMLREIGADGVAEVRRVVGENTASSSVVARHRRSKEVSNKREQ